MSPISLPSLVLLTEHFPFGITESFLEVELPYLARRFAVTVVPTSVGKHEYSCQRSVPDGVLIREDISRALSFSVSGWLRKLVGDPASLSHGARLMGPELRSVPLASRTIRRFVRFSFQALIVRRLLLEDVALKESQLFYSYWLTANALALAEMRTNGHPAVRISRAHRGDLYAGMTTGDFQPFRQPILSGLDWVVCISEHGRDYLNTNFPGVQDKVTVSKLGVRKQPVRSKASQDGRLHLVTCAHLKPVKRIDRLIESLGIVTAQVRWTHLGGGGEEDRLKQQAQALPANIEWHITGSIPNQAVLDFFRKQPVDLFLNLSSSEGLPVSIMEAMSFGVPVAATDVGGTAELVKEGNGILLPADIQPEALAQFLDAYQAQESEKKHLLRECAWHTWSIEADADRQYERFSNWLFSLI